MTNCRNCDLTATVTPAATQTKADREFAESDDIGADDPPPLHGLLRDWYESYARCILARSGGERVHMSRVIHYLPEIEWMQQSIARGEPLTLNEPQSFTEFPDRHIRSPRTDDSAT